MENIYEVTSVLVTRKDGKLTIDNAEGEPPIPVDAEKGENGTLLITVGRGRLEYAETALTEGGCLIRTAAVRLPPGKEVVFTRDGKLDFFNERSVRDLPGTRIKNTQS